MIIYPVTKLAYRHMATVQYFLGGGDYSTYSPISRRSQGMLLVNTYFTNGIFLKSIQNFNCYSLSHGKYILNFDITKYINKLCVFQLTFV